jgi:hypothetical protein
MSLALATLTFVQSSVYTLLYSSATCCHRVDISEHWGGVYKKGTAPLEPRGSTARGKLGGTLPLVNNPSD